MLVNVKSDVGLVRKINEDSYACVPPDFYIVADGMGGHAAGEIASRLGVDAAVAALRQYETQPESLEEMLRGAVVAANRSIYEKARSHPAYGGMGTTISMVYFLGGQCFWAHVGDSRIYLHRSGILRQITKDHSLVWDLVANGTITPEEALTHPQRNMLMRAVGVNDTVEVDTGAFAVELGDKFLLCSDGLTNMVSADEIAAILAANHLDDKAETLVDAALRAGGIDNITALVLES